MKEYQVTPLKGRRLAFVTLFSIVLTSMLVGLGSRSLALDESGKPQTEAVSAMLFDDRRGQVIFSKASDEITHSPLVNRIMLALIAVEKVDMEALVTASKDVVNTKGATLKLSLGEKYPVKNLMYALMLTGSPDASQAVAEFIGGSEDGFVSMMNEYASKLQMSNTHFTNSSGAFDEKQVTTAGDIAVLMKYALSNADFNRFFSTQAKTWYDEMKTLLLTNSNSMFWSYKDTDGGMTAGLDKGLQSIITTVTRNNMRLVCVLLDVPSGAMNSDSINILNYGFDNYLYGTLVSAGSSHKEITIEGQPLNLITTTDVHYIYPKGQSYIKNMAINVDESKLKPPITTKTIVGMVTFTLMDDTVINVDLYPDREILPQKTKAQIMKERLEESRELIYVIIGLIVLELIVGLVKLSLFIKRKIIKLQSRRLRSK